jgi:hypothetical protein
MQMNRRLIRRSTIAEDDDGYVEADMSALISMVWEITKDAWSFVKEQNAEHRLQRNVATIIRRRS